MEFTCVAGELAKALSFVSQRTETVRLDFHNQKLTLETRSQIVGIQLERYSTAGPIPGSAVVPLIPLTALLRALGDRITTCNIKDGRFVVTAGKSRTALGIYADDTQRALNFSAYETPNMMIYADSTAVDTAMGKVLSCSALMSASHPMLESVYSEITEETLRFVGCDGQKLAWVDVDARWVGSLSSAIIPLALISEIRRRLPKKIPIEMAWNKGFLVGWYGARIAGPVLAGTYPAYRQLVPPSFAHEVTFKRMELLTAVLGVCAAAPDAGVTLRLSFQQQTLFLALIGSEIASSEDEISCESGLDLEIGFVPRNFLEGLKAMTTETVTLRMNDPMHVVEIVGDPNLKFFVMPLALDKRAL